MTTALLAIGLMILGLALVAIEVLVIPGIGIIGFLGAIAMLGSSYVSVTEFQASQAAILIAAGMAGAGVMFWLFPRTKVAQAMILSTQTTGGAANPELRLLMDREGTAMTPLRPSGAVKIDDKPIDVVSDGQYIDAGTRVRVILVEGARVVVEPIS